MNLRGFDGHHVRAPLIDLQADVIGLVEQELRRLAADPRSGVTLK